MNESLSTRGIFGGSRSESRGRYVRHFFSGNAVPFGAWTADSRNITFERWAFDDCLADVGAGRHRVELLFDHDGRRKIGDTTDVLSLRLADDGLRVFIDLSRSPLALAEEVSRRVARGCGLSIGWCRETEKVRPIPDYTAADWTAHSGRLASRITRATIREVSLVSDPALPTFLR